ncbi:MAG: transcription-repair coupling factor [Acidaminococcales bacterium]|nr:transcription-repair coupling factor [Acidaminococcales bacterium]
MLIAAPGREELREMRRGLNALLPDAAIEEFYPADRQDIAANHKSLEITAARLSVLRQLCAGQRRIVIVTAEALAQPLEQPQELLGSGLALSAGAACGMGEAAAAFIAAGYERSSLVDAPGQFSVRGGIIDIFPPTHSLPLRIEWLGGEIESIRSFSAETQRSLEGLKETVIPALARPDGVPLTASLLDYLPASALFVIDEPARLKERLAPPLGDSPSCARTFSWRQLTDIIGGLPNFLCLSALPLQMFPHARPVRADIRAIPPYHRQWGLLAEDLKKYLDKNIQPVISMSSDNKAAGMIKTLSGLKIPSALWPDGEPRPKNKALAIVGGLAAGMEFVGENWLLITEQDIFGAMKQRRLTKKPPGQAIRYFSEIKAGDYVVHSVHGIGRYVGSESLAAGGATRDYLLIRYAGDDKLYVPVDQVQTLQKYIGAEGQPPRLSRMGGADWGRVRGRARAAVTEMAAELLRLQAERKLLPGHAFSPDTVWQQEFEEAFPYEETPDQLRAIEEIKRDMERPYPMDRILCGDVGYGKTEVALRAAFKAVMDSKQVAVLVPTTVLAQQHLLTFSERMRPFGINIEMISRFRSPKEQRAALAGAAGGEVDIVIGTHRLLQNDINFKNLGLLVIDEEQRFGVGQKEKIKLWSKNVDVLSMSATPIPRTLHMGLVSARDMSIIETAPEERLPVESYVAEYSDELVRQAILREVRRGGYVYYVYNRVADIERVAETLRKLVPGISIKIAHGQMPEDLLETVMLEFYQGGFDVLLCTSIIENGLDIPLANTIIVHGAENFGLSQLYQMRGRVGRSSRLAYAWFFYPPDRILSEIAEKRLQAIRDFSDLGAGLRIAMRDLEIRGAGNILGPQQHGHIISVGFETYCRLLEESINELAQAPARAEPSAEPSLDVAADAYLPDDYIDDPGHKLDIYRRLQYINERPDFLELLAEMSDRFGEPPPPAKNLLRLALLRGHCRKLGVKSINTKAMETKIIFAEKASVNPETLLAMAVSARYAAVLRQGPPISVKIKRPKKRPPLDWIEEAIEFLLQKS